MRSTMPGRRADNGPVRARRPARGSRPCLTSTSWSSARDRRGEGRRGRASRPPQRSRSSCSRRDRAVGAPVRCAEGVGDAGLREFADPDGADWVSRRIKDVIFQAPDDTEVVMANSGVGWILDRTRFDAYLAAEAARSGAAVLVGTEATGMARNGDGRWHVQVKERGRETTYRARVVIGADGVETMVGRWAGLDTRVPSRDMESCAQYVLQGIDFNPDAIYLQFSSAIAPGGYAWIFPKGVGVANVGLGVVALKTD